MNPQSMSSVLSTRRSTRLQANKETSGSLDMNTDEKDTLQHNNKSQKRATPKALGAKAKKARNGYQDPFPAMGTTSTMSQSVLNIPNDVPLVLVPEPALSVAESIRFGILCSCEQAE
jgi:hypothetical protein